MKLLATAIFCGCGLVIVGAQRLDAARTVIDSYRVAIRMAEKDPSRRQLETAFNAIPPLREALVLANGGDSLLESLSEQEFTALRRELVGLHVNREEVVLVEPDVVFFGRLAERRADRFLRGSQVHVSGVGLACLHRTADRRQWLHAVRQRNAGIDIPHVDCLSHAVSETLRGGVARVSG